MGEDWGNVRNRGRNWGNYQKWEIFWRCLISVYEHTYNLLTMTVKHYEWKQKRIEPIDH